MKRSTGRFALMVASSTLVAVALAGCTPHSTGPTEVGVRTVKWSPLGKKGVQQKVYAPGSTYFFVPFLNDWHTFDTSLQKLEMSATEMRGDNPGRDDLVFKTVDGNDISLDVTILYRIDPEKASTILQDVAETDQKLKEMVVRTVARSKPRDIFGELETEDFYIAEKRSGKCEEAMKIIGEILTPYGIVVEGVRTGDYRFNEEYQSAIEQKKVADQQTERFKSETHAAQEEYLKKLEEARGEMGKIKAEADGEFERAKIEADAYYEQQKLIAEAIEAEGKAEAEGVRKMNEALAGSGGDAMIKLKIAEALTGKRILSLPMGDQGLDVRSTDVNGLLQLYGIQKLVQPKRPEPPAAPTEPTTSQAGESAAPPAPQLPVPRIQQQRQMQNRR